MQFSNEQKKELGALLPTLDKQQAAWLADFIKQNSDSFAEEAADGASGDKVALTIIYGTESGNCEALAADAAKRAKKLGFAAKVVDFADISPADLSKFDNAIIYLSTWGEGDAPERVVPFDKAFESDAPDLSGKKFAICALGDTSYVDFCSMGKKFDERFVELGAERVFERVDCDVDYHAIASDWTNSTLNKFAEIYGVQASAANKNASIFEVFRVDEYSQINPYLATLSEKLVLNGTGSAKETWHFEIDLSGSGMRYEVGDSLGVVPKNEIILVDDIISLLGLDDKNLREDLISAYDITALTKPVIEKYAHLTGDAKVAALLDDKLNEYIYGRGVIDLLQEFPHKITAEQLRGILRKVPPRLYSISSSQESVGEEVHLTVAAVRYEAHSRKRNGVASCYLADAVEKGGEVAIYVKPNKNFRLPANSNAPVIMVGPGTGVAPFRAFMQAREVGNAKGKNWLFFGDQHYNFDFLYQLEWQDWSASGLLTYADVAFSRDKPQKVYVQDKMREKAAELRAWLKDGAYFYVCGDESRMAKDVDAALREIAGDEVVEEMKQQGRYLRDVY